MAGTPNFCTFLTWASRLTIPRLSAATSGLPRSSFLTPPCILSARTVATTTATSGLSPPNRHLMLKNFSAPRSAPKPASVSTMSPSERPEPGGDEGIAAVGDVAERPGVHQCRPAFERLHQVRQDGVLEQQRHGARGLELARGYRLPVAGEADDDPADPGLEVGEIAREREDGHDLAAGHDDEPVFAHRSRVDAAETDDDGAERPVVHVDRPRPGDAARIDVERVALVQMVVEHRRQQIVRRRDRVEVAGEMEIDLVHRHHLRVSAARRAALHAEYRAEAGLADAHDHLLAQPAERLTHAHRHRALPLAGGRRVDAGHEHQPARRLAPGDGRPRRSSPCSGRTGGCRPAPRPSSAATSWMGRILAACAIAMSVGTLLTRGCSQPWEVEIQRRVRRSVRSERSAPPPERHEPPRAARPRAGRRPARSASRDAEPAQDKARPSRATTGRRASRGRPGRGSSS